MAHRSDTPTHAIGDQTNALADYRPRVGDTHCRAVLNTASAVGHAHVCHPFRIGMICMKERSNDLHGVCFAL